MKTLKDIAGTYLWEYAEDDGNDKAFVILTGLGGSTDGFGNKYSRIAEYVQSDYGFPAFIVPTPKDVWEKKERFFDEVAARFIQNKTCLWACRRVRRWRFGMPRNIRKSNACYA